MRYTAEYFKQGMPDWKRKKDPLFVKIIYRPLSFYVSAIVANNGIMANDISYFSSLVAIVSCSFFLFNNYYLHIAGAVLMNIWLLLDCVDGNLARSVKKQPFGEFADAMSSYILVAFMCSAVAVAVYYEGGVLVPPNSHWIIYCGAIASSSDTLMRLIYQKYKATERELISQGIVMTEEDDRTDHSKVSSWRVRIEMELGICFLAPASIFCSVFRCFDLFVFYCLFYFGGSCIVTTCMQIKKARIAEKRGNR